MRKSLFQRIRVLWSKISISIADIDRYRLYAIARIGSYEMVNSVTEMHLFSHHVSLLIFIVHVWLLMRICLVCCWSTFTIGCPAEWYTHKRRFAGNSSFRQAHAFEVLSPIWTYPIVRFICRNFVPNKMSSTISCDFIYNASGILKSWSFIVYVIIPAAIKAFALSVFLPGVCVI